MQLTEDQQRGKDLVDEGHNCAITGSAGVGKSYLMRQITDDETLVCAPTGISALNVGGVTASSLFSLPLGVCLDSDKYSPSKKAEQLFSNRAVKRIIFDEAYMTRLDAFELIDQKLRRITKIDEPFGSVQMVLVGDPYQLSPIKSQQDKKQYDKLYDSVWLFKSMAWQMGQFQPTLLREVMRQEDKRQQRILESIRTADKWAGKAVDRINEITSPTPIEGTWLCAYNAQAEGINRSRFKEINETPRTFTASGFGFKPNENPVPYNLDLKVGARVIIKANDLDGQYVNGSQGVVREIQDNSVFVELDDGRVVDVIRFTWEKYDYVVGIHGLEREVVGRYKQFPLKLGYGISIHGSQGCTLTHGNIHLGRGAFSAGQAYVALSRFTDLENIYIQNGLQYSDIIVDNEVKEFYKKMEENYAAGT